MLTLFFGQCINEKCPVFCAKNWTFEHMQKQYNYLKNKDLTILYIIYYEGEGS